MSDANVNNIEQELEIVKKARKNSGDMRIKLEKYGKGKRAWFTKMSKLVISKEKELLAKITKIILGSTPEEVFEQNLKDILAEILNTIAGRFLSKIIPEDQTFSLGLTVNEQDDYSNTDSSEITWYFTIDDIPFFLSASGAPLLQLCDPMEL